MRSGADGVVLHVDHVIGNQEIVVKHCGPQLSRMRGISGATILGSGEIVLILIKIKLASPFHVN
jgi:chemosensory pili system protein ChpA (sensor histidine kinase/response regulator)